MFTDIVGYTALMQQNEAKALQVRNRHRDVFQKLHEQFSGEIMQYYGDGTLSIFTSAIEAVKCAVSIQRQLSTGETVVPLRIGLHIGDIVYNSTEIYGDGVNIASRVESMGIPGAILLSGKLNDELKNIQEISTLTLGFFNLKNISNPLELFAVSNDGICTPKPFQLRGMPTQPKKSIAVLPFVNMSSSSKNKYFCDGMTEEVINLLTKYQALKVTSRTSSFSYKNKNLPIAQIGQELDVSYILEGSIRKCGNKIRVTAQLIDVLNDSHYFSETFDRSLENTFTIQDELGALIVSKLHQHIFQKEQNLTTNTNQTEGKIVVFAA